VVVGWVWVVVVCVVVAGWPSGVVVGWLVLVCVVVGAGGVVVGSVCVVVVWVVVVDGWSWANAGDANAIAAAAVRRCSFKDIGGLPS
jgi:hypothetical protein